MHLARVDWNIEIELFVGFKFGVKVERFRWFANCWCLRLTNSFRIKINGKTFESSWNERLRLSAIFLWCRRQATNIKSKIHLQMEFRIHLSLDFKLTKAEKAHLHKIYYKFLVCLTNRKIPPEREKESQPLEPISHGVCSVYWFGKSES